MQKVFDDKGLTEKVQLDSAGTHAYHVDEPPDPRAIAAARRARLTDNPVSHGEYRSQTNDPDRILAGVVGGFEYDLYVWRD
jgi:protein-tyrosine-phosphatase